MNFPLIDASLNLLTTLFLISGFIAIKSQKITWHRFSMVAAFFTSILFLGCYLTYHLHAGSKHYTGEGWLRTVYFSLLLSHTILATVIVPMILRTLYLALRKNFPLHMKWARWTWPLWMYVSVTGVIIYLMLY